MMAPSEPRISMSGAHRQLELDGARLGPRDVRDHKLSDIDVAHGPLVLPLIDLPQEDELLEAKYQIRTALGYGDSQPAVVDPLQHGCRSCCETHLEDDTILIVLHGRELLGHFHRDADVLRNQPLLSQEQVALQARLEEVSS